MTKQEGWIGVCRLFYWYKKGNPQTTDGTVYDLGFVTTLALEILALEATL